MPRNLIKSCGGRPWFFCEQPYYLKHSPGNGCLGSKHNQASVGYGEGFDFAKMNPIYRFRWNMWGGTGPGTHPCFYMRNPGGKVPHWLEVSMWKKFSAQAFSSEAMMHVQLACCVTAIVIWNLTRYLFFHPDLTIYNVIYWNLKRWTNMLRNNEPMTLDQPVFRWSQGAPEFYNFSVHRDMFELGVLANDPYVEYIKSIGREKELLIYPDSYGLGEGGRGKLTTYLPKMQKGDKWEDPTKPPRHWYVGPEGHGPHHHDHGHGHGHGHGDDSHGHGNEIGHSGAAPHHDKSGGFAPTILGGPHKYTSGLVPKSAEEQKNMRK